MIQLDYNATTPIDSQVALEIHSFIYERFGNPSSNPSLGCEAKQAVELTRAQVAVLLGCSSEEILFTSGGSESNNMVIKGSAYTLRQKGNHIITSTIEYPAILNRCKHLEEQGYRISYLTDNENEIVQVSWLKNMLTDRTILVTVMLANNETGTTQPIEEISHICRKHNVLIT